MQTQQAVSVPTLHNAPGYYHFSRPNVRALIPAAARRVLDVGCAAGALGAALRAERPAVIVEGIEIVPAAAREARTHLHAVYEGAVEDVAAALPRARYDAVILADVLEHTVDPGLVLRLLRPTLAPGGALIVSLPNVRHWSVLRQLLEGRFDYVDLGILDRTHLRFYTRMTMLQLLAEAGFAPVRLAAVRSGEAAPQQVVAALAAAGLMVDSLADESGAYQYLSVCQTAPARQAPQDDASLVGLLAEVSGAGSALLGQLAIGQSGLGQAPPDNDPWNALWPVAQGVALLAQATGPGRLSPELSTAFTRVLGFALDRLGHAAETGNEASLRAAMHALGQLQSAISPQPQPQP